MEDLRFLSPTTAGTRSEVDSIATQAETGATEKHNFRNFLSRSYTETANVTNGGLKADSDKSSGAAEQGDVPSEKTFPTLNRSSALAIHARSKEIGRVIFTRDPNLEDIAHVNMGSLNAGADVFLSRFVGDPGGSSKSMVDHIRETMLGATGVASGISKAISGGELNNNQLGMLKLSETNSWPEVTQQINPDLSRSMLGAVKLISNEPQHVSVVPELNPSETGGAARDQLTSNISQTGDLGKLVKPSAMDFLMETGSSDHDSIQAGSNSARGESGDQAGNQRDSEKQDANGRPSSSERDRQEWRERFAEIISDRIKLKVDEGEWLVRMSLQAAGLGSFDVSLKSDDRGVFGSIHTDDPEVRELLNSALPELERALNESLSSQAGQKVRLEVLDDNSLVESGGLLDSREIVITASELSNSLPERFKAGDGLDVFV